MNLNTNQLNKIRYTLYSPGYDWAARILNRSRAKSLNCLNIEKDDKVLIIGAGTGLDLELITVDCEITAIDITPSMVKKMKKKNLKLNRRLHAEVMDGQNLSFQNETFDKIILHLIISVIPDPVKTIIEAERVLKTKGKIALFDKFVPTNQKASLIRKTFNLFTNLFFSDITRSFEQINSHSSLTVISDEKADIGGTFRIIQLEK